MTSLFEKLFGGDRRSSGQTAKDRLQLVLMHDRSDLSPMQLQQLKDEILEVISRYVEFDPERVEIDLTSEDRASMIKAEIPIEGGKRRRRPLVEDTGEDDKDNADLPVPEYEYEEEE